MLGSNVFFIVIGILYLLIGMLIFRIISKNTNDKYGRIGIKLVGITFFICGILLIIINVL